MWPMSRTPVCGKKPPKLHIDIDAAAGRRGLDPARIGVALVLLPDAARHVVLDRGENRHAFAQARFLKRFVDRADQKRRHLRGPCAPQQPVATLDRVQRAVGGQRGEPQSRDERVVVERRLQARA
ncbi:MAG: hypothetical protein M5U33_09815 [Pseudorhodoplanes sp.]|nr:hypothetical protein [Pseudorhodoplanes sp.]